MINIFYLADNPFGGWVTFTHHLIRALERAGEEVRLFKVGTNFEDRERSFGYGHTYQNIDLSTAAGLVKDGGGIIAATDKRHMPQTRLLREMGAVLVVHDPTEFKYLPGVTEWERVITIRPSVQKLLPRSTFIPHPYERYASTLELPWDDRKRAVSVSRIDFDKRTDILLDANRILLAKGHTHQDRITIRGFENRIYTRFHIVEKYPEWTQSIASFPRDNGVAFNLCQQHKYMVDMSEIKGDGGGTQYSFLEAMDAGTIPILNAAWGEGEMRDMQNCIMVSNASELAEIISNDIDDEFRADLICGFTEILHNHGPEVIGPQYLHHLTRG